MLIVMLNFLIAEVGQTYDDVKSLGKQFLYFNKCQINTNTFNYRSHFKKMFGMEQDKFEILVFRCA